MARDNVKLTTLTVREQKFEVHVRTDGRFLADFEGEDLVAYTLKELEEKLMRVSAVKPKRVSVPVSSVSEDHIQHGIYIGQHAANRNHLIRWDGETHPEQVRNINESWGHERVLHRLTDSEIAEWRDLRKAAKQAEQAVKGFVNRHKFNPDVALKG